MRHLQVTSSPDYPNITLRKVNPMLAQTQTAIAAPSLILTVVELISRRPNFEDSIEAGCEIHDFKSVRILSKKPLPMSAVSNVLHRNPAFKLHNLTAKNHQESYEF
jgi:hypothetical protein